MKQVLAKLFLVCLIFGESKSSFSQNCYLDFTIRTKIELPGCFDNGQISVGKVEGGTAPYRFRLNGTSNSTGVFTGLSSSEYILYVIDSLNCMDSSIINLIPDPNRKIFSAPNAFSPNGDGVNDLWIVGGVENHKGVKLTIFNKWGQEIFNSPDYKNQYAWNGKKGSSELPEATYFYVFSVLQDCREINQSGTITIVR